MNILHDSCNEPDLPGAGNLLVDREDDLDFCYLIGKIWYTKSKFTWTLTRLHDGFCQSFVTFEDLIHMCEDMGLERVKSYTLTEVTS